MLYRQTLTCNGDPAITLTIVQHAHAVAEVLAVTITYKMCMVRPFNCKLPEPPLTCMFMGSYQYTFNFILSWLPCTWQHHHQCSFTTNQGVQHVSNHIVQRFGIKIFITGIKFCVSPYIINYVMWIA